MTAETKCDGDCACLKWRCSDAPADPVTQSVKTTGSGKGWSEYLLGTHLRDKIFIRFSRSRGFDKVFVPDKPVSERLIGVRGGIDRLLIDVKMVTT